MKALRLAPHVLFPLIFSLLFLFGFGCDDDDDSTVDDDDDSAVDDDDDDSIDDDSSGDDDSADDDTSSDDDSIADDDTSDDDTAGDDDDDDWPDICQNPTPDYDDCGSSMFFLYCEMGYPIIIEDTVFTQLDAELACRAAAEPVWVDILECSDRIIPLTVGGGFITEFVGCLAGKDWPAQHTELFDVTQWLPADDKKSSYDVIQSLNFWAFVQMDAFPFGMGEIGGAVVDLQTPAMRADNCFLWDDGRYWSQSFAAGAVTDWQPETIVFWLEGFWERGGINGYDQGTIAEEMRLAPASK